MTITSVRKQPSGFWIVVDSDGVKHKTENAMLALWADRLRLKGSAVEIDSGSGWYYRNLREIKDMDPDQSTPDHCTCVAGTSRFIWVSPMVLQCRRCHAVKRSDRG